MKNKIGLGIITFFIILFGFCVISNATISAQSKEVNSEEQFTLSITSDISLGAYSVKAESYSGLTFITSTGGTGKGTATISNALQEGGTTSLATFTFKAPKVEKDTKYTIKFVATGMGDENLSPVPNSEATATITVKAPVVTPPTQPETPTTPTTPPATVTKSSEARLKNFGIKPNDFSGFKRDKFEYTTEVPNSVSEVEIYAEKLHDKATVQGTGKVSLKEGNNTFEVKVTAEDGKTTKTYKLTIKRKTAAEEQEAQGEARLSSLGVKPEKYDFEGFNKDKTEYSVQIPENINEIEVYATAVNPNAQITGTGIITLEEGESTLEIVVISENGTKKTYSINVIRTEAETTEEPEQPIEEKFGLSKLTVTGLTLSPKFDVETYEYTLDLKQDLTSLEIIAKANDENATVEIVGNENLQEGENVITILVKNAETDEVATYQIIVNKTTVAEEVQMSWLKPSTWGKEEIIKIILIVVLIILIISAIILKINISKENKKAKKVDLPGADELDKAIAEHQELAEEEINNEETIEKDEAKANFLEEIAKSRLGEDDNSDFAVEDDDIKPRKRGKHF